jgi:hypothetical protein
MLKKTAWNTPEGKRAVRAPCINRRPYLFKKNA